MKNDVDTIALQEKEVFQPKKSNFNTNLVHKLINIKNNSIFFNYSTKKRRYKIFTINNFALIFFSFFILNLSLMKICNEYYSIYGEYKSPIKLLIRKLFTLNFIKQKKTVYFTDSADNNYWYLLGFLKDKYNIIETNKNPNYLIYSVDGIEHNNPKYNNSIKIFQTTINYLPDFNECDYAFAPGFLNYEDRYIRFPYYLRREIIYDLQKERMYIPGKKFCAWVVSNRFFEFRNKFFNELSKYKKIDSGGNFKNNVGRYVDDKITFLSEYKFSIQFENSGTIGYTTEKIFDGFKAGTIPIYYGDETIVDIINPNSFIFIRNKSDFKNAIELIKKIDNDEKLYKKMFKEPIYKRDFIYTFSKEEDKIKNFLYYIFDQDYNKAKRRYNIK